MDREKLTLAGIAMVVVGFFVVLAAAVGNLAIKGGAAVGEKSMTFEGRRV